MRVKDEVKQILSENKLARDSDKELIREYFKRKGLHLSPEQDRIFFSISTETVRRSRQQLQSEGIYPPTEQVKRVRAEKAKKIRETVRHTPVEEILEAPPQKLFDDKNFRGIF